MKRDLLLMDDTRPAANAAPDPRVARLAEGIERVGGWTRRARWPLMLAGALFCVYLPVLSMSYLFMDDYIQLHGPDPVNETVWFFVSLGRPLVGGYLMLCRFFVHAFGSNMLCHLLGVVGVALLGTATHRWLRRHEIASPDAALLCFLIGALPAMQVYMTWITAGSFVYAAWLAVWALLVFDPDCGSHAPPRAFPGWPRWAGAVTLMVAAMMIYQPSAMYFWSMALAGLLAGWRQTPRQIVRRGAAYFGLGGLSLAAYWVALQVMFAATGMAPNERSRLLALGDIPGKLGWFVSEPLDSALSLWRVQASRELSLLIAGIIVAGLVVKWRLLRRASGQSGREASNARPFRGVWTLYLAGMIVAMLPLSYLFNLVVAENWASYRTTFALAASVAVLGYVALDALSAWAGREGQAVLRRAALCGCAVGALLSVQENAFRRIAFPQAVEYRFLEHQLQTAGLTEKTAIHMIRPAYDGGLCKRVFYEFGAPSSSAPWVPVPMIRKALREMGLRPEQFKITHGTADEPIPRGAGVAVIDMRELALLREPAARR